MLLHLWVLTRGYRLWPWRSPYLRWRMETYSGVHADEITFLRFWKLAWSQRHELIRYLRWADHMRSLARKPKRPPIS